MTTPIIIANENVWITAPPNKNRMRTTKNVVRDVIIVRLSDSLMLWLTIDFRSVFFIAFTFSRILSKITSIFSKNRVSIKRLVQNPNKNKKSSSIIIITHKSKDKSLNKILNEVARKEFIRKKPKLIRIDDN